MIKVAYLYWPETKNLSGIHFDHSYYRFYFQTFPKMKQIEYTMIPREFSIDVGELNRFDVVIVNSLYENACPCLDGLEKVKALKVVQSVDSHKIGREPIWIERYREYGISFAYFIHQPSYFYQFVPKDIEYHQIFHGVIPEIYESNISYPFRKKDEILLTGYFPIHDFFVLRQKCSSLSFVDYVGRDAGYIGDKYPILLERYRAGIVAATKYPVLKNIELPMTGMLTFHEVTERNAVADIGFIEGENAVFIDDSNYVERMEEYLDTVDDLKWERIAKEGQRFVLEKYASEVQAAKLIDLMKERL